MDIILKVDVVGSLEVLEQALLAIPQEKVALRFVNAGVGEITETDVKTAVGTKARIIGFRTKAQVSAIDLAEREKVQIETFDVIYELIKRVRVLMEKNIEPELIKTQTGALKVLAVFLTDKNRQILGGKVSSGEVKKGSKLEVFRKEDFIGTGKIGNLQKNKKDVSVEEGDVLNFFVQETQQSTL